MTIERVPYRFLANESSGEVSALLPTAATSPAEVMRAAMGEAS